MEKGGPRELIDVGGAREWPRREVHESDSDRACDWLTAVHLGGELLVLWAEGRHDGGVPSEKGRHVPWLQGEAPLL